MNQFRTGQKIRINHLANENNAYDGKTGTITHIDGIGQLHGTWGGLAVIPEEDDFEIVENANENLQEQTKALIEKMTFQELIEFWNEHAADHYERNLLIQQMDDKEWRDYLIDTYGEEDFLEAEQSGIEEETFSYVDTHYFYNINENILISFSNKEQLLERIGKEFFVETLKNLEENHNL